MKNFMGILLLCLATQSAVAENLVVSSPQLKEGERIPEEQVFNGFGCQGGNISPAVEWAGAPEGTRSYAITLYDPDAPTGSGWWHWVVFNIPAGVHALPKGAGNPQTASLPQAAIQSRTDFGKSGYGGPCPPQGDKPHRYQLTVYALKVDRLPLDETAPAAMVGFYLHQNVLKKAVLSTRYGR